MPLQPLNLDDAPHCFFGHYHGRTLYMYIYNAQHPPLKTKNEAMEMLEMLLNEEHGQYVEALPPGCLVQLIAAVIFMVHDKAAEAPPYVLQRQCFVSVREKEARSPGFLDSVAIANINFRSLNPGSEVKCQHRTSRQQFRSTLFIYFGTSSPPSRLYAPSMSMPTTV